MQCVRLHQQSFALHPIGWPLATQLGGVWLGLGPVGEPVVVVEVAGDKALLGAGAHAPAATGEMKYQMEAPNCGPSLKAQPISPADKPTGLASQPGAPAQAQLGQEDPGKPRLFILMPLQPHANGAPMQQSFSTSLSPFSTCSPTKPHYAPTATTKQPSPHQVTGDAVIGRRAFPGHRCCG